MVPRAHGRCRKVVPVGRRRDGAPARARRRILPRVRRSRLVRHAGSRTQAQRCAHRTHVCLPRPHCHCHPDGPARVGGAVGDRRGRCGQVVRRALAPPVAKLHRPVLCERLWRCGERRLRFTRQQHRCCPGQVAQAGHHRYHSRPCCGHEPEVPPCWLGCRQRGLSWASAHVCRARFNPRQRPTIGLPRRQGRCAQSWGSR